MSTFNNTIDTIQVIASDSSSSFKIVQEEEIVLILPYDAQPHVLRDTLADAITRMASQPALATYSVREKLHGTTVLGYDVTTDSSGIASYQLIHGTGTVAGLSADEAANLLTLCDQAFAAIG